MSLLRGWFKPDFSDPRDRFTDLDGAPYDGKPDGAHPIWRAVRTPVFKATLIAGAFVGAAAALFADQGAKQDVLMVLSVCVPCGSLVLPIGDANDRRREYPSLKNVVIDKAGRGLSDAEALFAVDDHYQRDIDAAPRFLPVIPFTVSVLLTGYNHVMGYPLLENAGIGAAVAVMLAVPFAARAAWACYARRQLDAGRWTITATPPPLKKEAREPEQHGLFSALVPVGVRAVPTANR